MRVGSAARRRLEQEQLKRGLPQKRGEPMPAFLGNLGVPELLVIFLILLFLFGARRLPEIARGLGQAIEEFRKGVKGPDKPA